MDRNNLDTIKNVVLISKKALHFILEYFNKF
jgi:hypothetical protein